MSIQELDEKMIRSLPPSITRKTAILFTTPLCGTCKVAERMLEIAIAAGVSTPLYKANINYMPALGEQWQITSIPCLIIIKDGQPHSREYAMKSVDHLYTLLK